jgi:hypothetical protein
LEEASTLNWRGALRMKESIQILGERRQRPISTVEVVTQPVVSNACGNSRRQVWG